MSAVLLYGWDYDQWRRVFDWAGEEMPCFPAQRIPDIKAFLAVRERWMVVGGPRSGPSRALFLS